jgi:ABC-type polysaccharide/polyol phosphate export permease
MDATEELIIEAGHTERNYWPDLFRYRELFYFLTWRDVLFRYEQTVIGILWASRAISNVSLLLILPNSLVPVSS